MYEDMLNGGSAYDEFSKIFDFEDFGYREIRVERPLRLSFQVTDERLQALALDRTVLRLSDGERDGLLEFLRASFTDEDIFMSRKSFEKALSQHAKSSNRKIGPPIRKAILNLFAERNENADRWHCRQDVVVELRLYETEQRHRCDRPHRDRPAHATFTRVVART